MRGLILIFTFTILCLDQSSAQDIHFSQFNRSYLNLSPSLSGDFKGDYRFNGNYRNQWSSISEPFRSFSFSAEAKGLFNQFPAINLGFIVTNDQAGVGDLQYSRFLLSPSYAFGLNEDSTLIFKGGLQFGLRSRSINYDVFTFDEQYRGGTFNPQLASGENFENNSINSLELNFGVSVEFKRSERHKAEAGIAVYNLDRSDQSFNSSPSPLDLRNNFFIDVEHYLSEKIDIMPALLYSNQGDFSELLFGSNFRYYFSKSSYYKRNLYLGLWYRNGDALIPSVGFDYNQWHFGFSYDVNISSLEVATNQQGGLEFSVTYIMSRFNPAIKTYRRCPKFL